MELEVVVEEVDEEEVQLEVVVEEVEVEEGCKVEVAL